jgi:uncharacterized membrane protein YoaK (UPF0700 family)
MDDERQWRVSRLAVFSWFAMSRRSSNITRLLDRGSFNDRVLRQLGGSMAFIAGALNAGGFLAVQRYTSHVSGIVSGMADDLALGEIRLSLSMLIMLLCFIGGAMHSTWLILWARRQRLRGGYGVSMMEEAVLLLLFGCWVPGWPATRACSPRPP